VNNHRLRTTGSDAIRAAFDKAGSRGQCALIPYLTLGYPCPESSVELILALQEGGADVIELGVPFSDPVADGPTIQAASQAALRAGMTAHACLDLVRDARRAGTTVPIVLMGYYNPIHAYGLREYARDCSEAGVQGLIVPDLPPEEADPLRQECRREGLALVFLVAPTTKEERIAKIASASEGFLYVVSRLGTTGAGRNPGAALSDRVALVRRYAHTPVVVGFGIARPEQAKALASVVDGVVVGSAVVDKAKEGTGPLLQYVSTLRRALAR